jgi:hypothetical protein
MSDFLPFVVIGISVGAIYGLAGTGLVLTYRSRLPAYGKLATVSCSSSTGSTTSTGWRTLAAVICVFAGPGDGILFELLARRLMTVDHTLQSRRRSVWCCGRPWAAWFQHVTGVFRRLATSTVEIGSVNAQWQHHRGDRFARRHDRPLRRFTRLGTACALSSTTPTQSPTARAPSSAPLGVIIGSSFAALSGLLIAEPADQRLVPHLARPGIRCRRHRLLLEPALRLR